MYNIWYGVGDNDSLELDGMNETPRLFAEIATVAAKHDPDADAHYSKLYGVKEACESGGFVASPRYCSQVTAQVKLMLREHGPKLSKGANRLLGKLARLKHLCDNATRTKGRRRD